MKKNYLLLYLLSILIATLFYLPAFAQSSFQETFSGKAPFYYDPMGNAGYIGPYSIQQTHDGGYIMAGYTTTYGAGGNDVYLVKTNSSGAILWTKTFGGTSDDFAFSVQQTTDRGYIVAGSTASFGAGGNDVYLIKTDSTGTYQWSKTYGKAGDEFGYSVQQTLEGGYIINGFTNSMGSWYSDQYLIKTNSIGDTLWTKVFGGGTYNHFASFIVQQTLDGGYISSGIAYPSGGVEGQGSPYLIKTNANGNKLWSKNYTYGNQYLAIYSLQQTSDKGYMMAGSYVAGFSADSASGIILLKTDSLGTPLWGKTFDGEGDDALISLHCPSVQQTSDHGYITTGTYEDNSSNYNNFIFLVKTDSTGTLKWSNTFTSSTDLTKNFDDEGFWVHQTKDGGYMVAGTSSIGADVYSIYNPYLIKTDANGHTSGCNEYTQTVRQVSSSFTSTLLTVNSYAGGSVGNPATVKGSGGSATVLCTVTALPIELLFFTGHNEEKVNVLEWQTASESNNDYFTVEHSADALNFTPFATVKGAGNSSQLQQYSTVDSLPATKTTYYRLKQTDYDGNYTYSNTIAIGMKTNLDIISIYPNPANNNLQYLLTSTENVEVNIAAIDLLGRRINIQTKTISKGVNQLSIDVSAFSTGLYLLQITSSSGINRVQKEFMVK